MQDKLGWKWKCAAKIKAELHRKRIIADKQYQSYSSKYNFWAECWHRKCWKSGELNYIAEWCLKQSLIWKAIILLNILYYSIASHVTAIGCYKSLWTAIGCYKSLWTAIGCYKSLWTAIGCYKSLWTAIGCYKSLWTAIGCYKSLWTAIGCYKSSWIILLPMQWLKLSLGPVFIHVLWHIQNCKSIYNCSWPLVYLLATFLQLL